MRPVFIQSITESEAADDRYTGYEGLSAFVWLPKWTAVFSNCNAHEIADYQSTVECETVISEAQFFEKQFEGRV